MVEREGNWVKAERGVGSMRPFVLSTMITCFKEGTSSDSRARPRRLGTRWVRREMLERGSLKGRLVSRPMIRCDAER